MPTSCFKGPSSEQLRGAQTLQEAYGDNQVNTMKEDGHSPLGVGVHLGFLRNGEILPTPQAHPQPLPSPPLRVRHQAGEGLNRNTLLLTFGLLPLASGGKACTAKGWRSAMLILTADLGSQESVCG